MHCALGVAQNVHWGNRPDSIHLVVVVIIDVVVVIVVVVVVVVVVVFIVVDHRNQPFKFG